MDSALKNQIRSFLREDPTGTNQALLVRFPTANPNTIISTARVVRRELQIPPQPRGTLPINKPSPISTISRVKAILEEIPNGKPSLIRALLQQRFGIDVSRSYIATLTSQHRRAIQIRGEKQSPQPHPSLPTPSLQAPRLQPRLQPRVQSRNWRPVRYFQTQGVLS